MSSQRKREESQEPARTLDSGVAHSKAGRLQQAHRDFTMAERLAAKAQDAALADRAMVFRIAVEVELGSIHGRAALLQQVLLRNHDPEVCFFAAYNTARCYDLERAWDKALFYARVARKWSRQTERVDCMAMTHNLFGNLLLAESQFGEARDEYDVALKLMPLGPSLQRALVLDNLGYCHIVLGDFAAGFSLLYESLRMLIHLEEPSRCQRPRLSLCFAYLEIGRYGHAIRQGSKALGEAHSAADETSIKNALYLLGQAHNLDGDEAAARRYFSELQETFYPHDGHIPDFLLAIDVRRILHLKA